MKRTAAFFACFGMGVAGCSSEPPTIREAAPAVGEQAPQAVFAPPAKPLASDPVAAKVLAEALATHTNNDLTKLAKLKVLSLVRSGGRPASAGVQFALEWSADLSPGRYRAKAVMRQGAITDSSTIIIAPDAGSRSATGLGGQTTIALDSETLKDCHTQRQEDEILALHPLADPSVLALPAPDTVVNNAPATGVYVWTSALAPALLHFDKVSKRLVKLTYNGRESSREVRKELVIHGHAEFGGVWLASKFTLSIEGNPFLEIEKQTYEPGKNFPADHFKP